MRDEWDLKQIKEELTGGKNVWAYCCYSEVESLSKPGFAPVNPGDPMQKKTFLHVSEDDVNVFLTARKSVLIQPRRNVLFFFASAWHSEHHSLVNITTSMLRMIIQWTTLGWFRCISLYCSEISNQHVFRSIGNRCVTYIGWGLYINLKISYLCS